MEWEYYGFLEGRYTLLCSSTGELVRLTSKEATANGFDLDTLQAARANDQDCVQFVQIDDASTHTTGETREKKSSEILQAADGNDKDYEQCIPHDDAETDTTTGKGKGAKKNFGKTDLEKSGNRKESDKNRTDEVKEQGELADKRAVIWQSKRPTPVQKDIDDEAFAFMLDFILSKEVHLNQIRNNQRPTMKDLRIWNKVAEHMAAKYNIGDSGEARCKTKFFNIKKQYMEYSDNMKKTGKGSMKVPKFFEEFHRIFGDRHNVNPTCVLNSSDSNIMQKLVPVKPKMGDDGSNDDDIPPEDLDDDPDSFLASSPSPSTSRADRPESSQSRSETPSSLPRTPSSLPPVKRSVKRRNVLSENLKELKEYKEREEEWNEKSNDFRKKMLEKMDEDNSLKKETSEKMLSFLERIAVTQEKRLKLEEDDRRKPRSYYDH